MKEFSQLIRDKREKLGFSMDYVCLAALEREGYKISKSLLNFYENGKRVPTYEAAYVLAKVLELEIKRTLRAAYAARIKFDMEKEKSYVEILVLEKDLKDIQPEEIVDKNRK